MRKLLVAALVVSSTLVPLPASADYGSGCPVFAFAGMKVFEDANGQQIPHPGQWFTTSYPSGICGPSEVPTLWTVVRKDSTEPFTTDTCFNAVDYVVTQEAGAKRCGRANGKIFYIATPGVYDVTAACPSGSAGPGSWTIELTVVD